MLKVKIIDNEKEYKSFLQRIDEIFDAKPGTDDFEELRLLSLLISKYEQENYPIEEADPIQLIKFKMSQLNLGPSDLPEVGNRITIWKILNYKVPISKKAAIFFSDKLNIPLELLIRPYVIKEDIQPLEIATGKPISGGTIFSVTDSFNFIIEPLSQAKAEYPVDASIVASKNDVMYDLKSSLSKDGILLVGKVAEKSEK